MIGYGAEQEAVVIRRKLRAGAAEIAVGDGVVRAAFGADFEPLRPFQFDRADGEEEGAREIADARDVRLLESFFGRDLGKALG